MGGVTAGGWPYITPTDHPKEYPAASQALANKLEGTLGALTPASGFTDFGSAYLGMFVTKMGPSVTVDALLKPTSPVSMTVGGNFNVATIPAGMRPAHNINAPALVAITGGSSFRLCRALVDTAGLITVMTNVAETLTTSGYIALNLAYRGA